MRLSALMPSGHGPILCQIKVRGNIVVLKHSIFYRTVSAYTIRFVSQTKNRTYPTRMQLSRTIFIYPGNDFLLNVK